MGLSSNRRSGRPWKDELDQYTVIARYFIQVILNQKKHDYESDHAFLERIFAVQERLIGKFEATQEFKMPGLYSESPMIRTQGVGYREVTPGKILHVRHDIRDPNNYDVSFFGGQGGAELWYQLTKSQWLSVLRSLKPLDHDAELLKHRDTTLK